MRLGCRLEIDSLRFQPPTPPSPTSRISSQQGQLDNQRVCGTQGVTRDSSQGAAASFPPSHRTHSGVLLGSHREAAGGEVGGSSLVPGHWLASLIPTGCPSRSSANLEQKSSPKCPTSTKTLGDPLFIGSITSADVCLHFTPFTAEQYSTEAVASITHFTPALHYTLTTFHASFIHSPLNGHELFADVCYYAATENKLYESMCSGERRLHCGLDTQGELSRWQTTLPVCHFLLSPHLYL